MVSVLTPDLSSLLWSTYYGGGGVGGYAERGRCLTLDNRGGIVVSGDTNSSDFPCTPGALQTSRAGDSDAFVLRIVSALVPIQGDADGDRHVDAVDLLRLAKAWLTVTGDAGYDASCDFDRNAHVGVIDLLMLANNWRI